MRTKRLATVKKTGKKYLVDSIDFAKKLSDRSRVFCFDELYAFEEKRSGGCATKHEGMLIFDLEEVDIKTIKIVDLSLAKELFKQQHQRQISLGYEMVKNTKRHTTFRVIDYKNLDNVLNSIQKAIEFNDGLFVNKHLSFLRMQIKANECELNNPDRILELAEYASEQGLQQQSESILALIS